MQKKVFLYKNANVDFALQVSSLHRKQIAVLNNSLKVWLFKNLTSQQEKEP